MNQGAFQRGAGWTWGGPICMGCSGVEEPHRRGTAGARIRPTGLSPHKFAPRAHVCYNDRSLGALREAEAMAKAVGAAPTRTSYHHARPLPWCGGLCSLSSIPFRKPKQSAQWRA